MDPPVLPSGGKPSPRKELNIQGPRPSALKVNKDSHAIRKPPQLPGRYPAAMPAAQPHWNTRIIYDVSPPVIYATESNFMTIVQQFTGSNSGDGDISPAARLATIERASPTGRDRGTSVSTGDELMGLVEGVELSQMFPGILSPVPAALPQISAGFFSPVNDLSPFWQGISSFMPSPSALFSASVISPTPRDLFNFDF